MRLDRKGFRSLDPSKVKPAPKWLGRRVGRFKLMALIGQGSMGRVFRAEDTNLNRQVALKILPSRMRLGKREVTIEQFIREARSASMLEHPNVVQVYEVNQSSTIWYIAMELLEGGNLHDLVKANGPMEISRACQLAAEAAEALDYAHRNAIIHRDIKPSNLMLTRSGRCKLTDFGLVRIDDPNDTFHLATEAVGTPLYLAPEIARGLPASGATDIYGLGCTLYYLLTGRHPFFGKTHQDVIKMHLSEPPPDLCDARPDLPTTLSQAIRTAMAKKPKERFESAGQFAKVLRVHTIPVGGSGTELALSSSLASAALALSMGKREQRPLWVWGSLVGAAVIGAAVVVAIRGTNSQGTQPTMGMPISSNPNSIQARVEPMQIASPVLPPPTTLPSAAIQAASSTIVPASAVVAAPPAKLTPAATFLATDAKHLGDIASGQDTHLAGQPIAVVGVVASVHLTTAGKMMHMEFIGVDNDSGFIVSFPPDLEASIHERITGASSSPWGRQKVRATGPLTLHKGRVEMRLESADQIELAK